MILYSTLEKKLSQNRYVFMIQHVKREHKICLNTDLNSIMPLYKGAHFLAVKPHIDVLRNCFNIFIVELITLSQTNP